jgi:hypothetical protein
MGAGGLLGGAIGGAAGAGKGIIEAASATGDDVISRPGYGKRSLVTPSGVIALNNKDNIIAYADDLIGTETRPYGSIAKDIAKDTAATVTRDSAVKIANKVVSKAAARMAINAIPAIGDIVAAIMVASDEYKTSKNLKGSISRGVGYYGASTVGGLAAGALAIETGPGAVIAEAIGSALAGEAYLQTTGTPKKYHRGGIVGGANDELPAILQRGEAVLSKLQIDGLNKIIGGMNTLSSFGDKFTSGANGLLSKVTGMFGGTSMGMASKIPGVGGLFGKKKAPVVSAMNAMMPEMGNMMSMLPFLSGAQPTTTQGTTQPQAPISVDTAGIEKQLNNFINALQGIQIHMDGAKVGKMLVNSNDAASSLGVFREQSR